MKKQYLDYAGLKRVLKHLLPGARKIWHGTLAEWEALSETERDKYDQAEIIDGSGYQADYVRNLHDPDWSNMQYYTAAQLNAGITIPARGIFICTVHTGSSQRSLSNLKINGKTVDWSYWNVEDGRFDLTKFCFSGPVCKGDIVTVTFNVYTGHDDDYTNFPIAFVPYKAQ